MEITKQIKKLNKERHKIIKSNQNAKQSDLRALLFGLDNTVNNLICIRIRQLKGELWEKEQICKRNVAKVKKNQIRLPLDI